MRLPDFHGSKTQTLVRKAEKINMPLKYNFPLPFMVPS